VSPDRVLIPLLFMQCCPGRLGPRIRRKEREKIKCRNSEREKGKGETRGALESGRWFSAMVAVGNGRNSPGWPGSHVDLYGTEKEKGGKKTSQDKGMKAGV